MLFDVEQVEVLRGPQGTRYGANALAGLVNVVTRPPTDAHEGEMELFAGNYGALGVGRGDFRTAFRERPRQVGGARGSGERIYRKRLSRC